MVPAYLLSAFLFIFYIATLFLKPKKQHRVLKGFGIATFCIVYMLSIALPAFLPVIDLPHPSGIYAVGTIRMDFTEPDRYDIVTGQKSPQKIAVQVWYPASNTGGKRLTRWMDSRKMASLFADMDKLPDIFGQLCLVKSSSYWDAELSTEKDSYPVVLFSCGLGMFVGQNTIQMEELASRGYVVFSVSHPHANFASEYSDGSIVPFDPNYLDTLSKDSATAIQTVQEQFDDQNSPAFQRALIRNCKVSDQEARVWSGDMIFIANQIESLNNGSIASNFKGRLNVENLGIFGHSFGGAAAGEASLNDSRFKAFINMDGTPVGDTVDAVINQPFMVLTTGDDRNIKLKAGEGYSANQKNYIVVSVNGTQHMNFTDLNNIVPYAGKALGALGSIKPDRQTEIMNTYIVAFFDKYLKGEQQSILDSSSSPYPEAAIEKR
jgi:predicted dienelactone hydrolase